jgi:hypothetical protein
MRSKKEINAKINKLKNIFLNSTNITQRLMLSAKIDAFKWVIEDNSDDSWMFDLQEDNQ